jgi:alginate O-acetyltransferase complex protein AlgI
MLFSSHIFLFVFLPVTLGGFCLLSRSAGPKAAKLWLTLASLVFYGWWNPVYVGLILASMLFNFWVGRRIGTAVRAGRSAAMWLFFGVGADLLLLAYYKYAGFFVANADALLATQWVIPKIVLPLGISFFTFTQIAYLVDASRGVVCEYDLGDFLLFITFFPHLIAGPIIHHREMMPQFAELRTYRFNWDNLAVGLGIFVIGLFKKVIIADALSDHVAAVFGAAPKGPLYAADAWAGTLCYGFQIYFDFSGYSDMAIGLARLFGITLPLNFNSPYRATSMIEFWRRWHMTLSRFLRDYLYIPLGGNRRGAVRRYANLVATMAIGGLWHGASWTFVLWGLFHGICLAVNHLWNAAWASRGERRRLLPLWLTGWAGRALTFGLVAIGWVLFRAVDLHSARQILEALFGMGAVPMAGTPALLKAKLWYWLAGLLAFVWCLPNTAQIARDYQPYPEALRDMPGVAAWSRWRANAAWACLAGLLLAASVLSLSKAGEFLYYNF